MVLPVRQKWQVLSPRCVPFLFDAHNANSHKIFHSVHCKGVEEMHYNSILQWGGLERVRFVVFVIKSGEFEPLGCILRLSCCVCVELSLQLSCYVLYRYRGHVLWVTIVKNKGFRMSYLLRFLARAKWEVLGQRCDSCLLCRLLHSIDTGWLCFALLLLGIQVISTKGAPVQNA